MRENPVLNAFILGGIVSTCICVGTLDTKRKVQETVEKPWSIFEGEGKFTVEKNGKSITLQHNDFVMDADGLSAEIHVLGMHIRSKVENGYILYRIE
jgi:hypothetical protein